MRAETLAEHLEKVQWAIRPLSITQNYGLINQILPVELSEITKQEICFAAKKLNVRRSCGTDGVPAEFWRAIILNGSCAMQWALEFCQNC